jgi:hypothetical protein
VISFWAFPEQLYEDADKQNIVTLSEVETSHWKQISGFDTSTALSAGSAHPDGNTYVNPFLRTLMAPGSNEQ